MSILTDSNALLEDHLIDMKFMITFTGMTDKWFYKLIKDGKYLKPIKLGSRQLYLEKKENFYNGYKHALTNRGSRLCSRILSL